MSECLAGSLGDQACTARGVYRNVSEDVRRGISRSKAAGCYLEKAVHDSHPRNQRTSRARVLGLSRLGQQEARVAE
jgi:hypothetical protein